MRIALVCGIDHYKGAPLYGCVNDAYGVANVLTRHGDGSVNFDCQLLVGTGPSQLVTKGDLLDKLSWLFRADVEIALFYFAGHGHLDSTGGYILASDSGRADDGITLDQVLALANGSPARNRVLILDSCHSGQAGTPATGNGGAQLRKGMTVLTASTESQYASEANGQGIFTGLLIDALSGGAANLTGDVTPGSVYAHIDQSLGGWEQRPVFKTNVQEFISLRRVDAPIDLQDLRRLSEFFPRRGFEFQLNPTFEPEIRGREEWMPNPNPDNVRTFKILQKYYTLGLVVPVGAPHMWHAAMESKACRLTALGEHYRNLVEKGRI